MGVYRRILALFVLLALAGCTADAPQNGKVHLVWATLNDETGIERKLADMFVAENPGVTVEILPMPAATDTIHNQFATYLISEVDQIDLYSIDVIWPSEFASAGWAVPLDDRFPPEERAKFLPGPIEACTFKGKIWAVPWYTDAGMLYYRKDLLDEAGLKPPTTWNDLVATATRLQTPERYGLVFQGAQYEGLICDMLEYMWGNNGNVLDKDGNVVLDSPENVAALQFVIDCIYKYKIAPPSVKTFKEDQCLQAFRAGSAVFQRNWPYVWGLTQRPREKLLGKVGVVPVPHSDTGKSAACLGGWNIMISKYSKHPDEAWKFTDFITSERAQKIRFMDAARLPTRTAVYEDPEVVGAHPHSTAFLDIFKLSRPRPVTPYYSKLSDIMQIQIHKAISQEIDAATALRNAAQEIRKISGFAKGGS